MSGDVHGGVSGDLHGARVARINPLTALATGLVIDLVLLLDLRILIAAAALGTELVLIPLAGLRVSTLARRIAPVAGAALVAGATLVLYGAPSGTVYLRLGLAAVTDGSLALGAAATVRLLAIALPAVVLLTGLDATRLADALSQRLHVPSRFVVAGLAATRLVELFGEDWRMLALARRARGIGDTGRLRRLPGQTFGLLVVALRRATSLATAMEVRGFGSPVQRTWARDSTFGTADVIAGAAGLCVAAAALVAGLLVGDGVR